MYANEISPIAQRLQSFINQLGITSATFADNCGLSRSNLSQTLSGRNKSVNDIFLTKIKTAYPDLNVSWLLFGNGTMREDANIEISEPQKPVETQEKHAQATDNKADSVCEPGEWHATVMCSNPEKETPTPSSTTKNTPSAPETVREIVKIMVLYSDNTFETFDRK